VAVVGPYGSGKTTLLESILSVTGAVQRKGAVAQKNTVGDASPEARARQMSVEVNAAATRYMDQSFTFLDCPGSIEFLADTLNVLPGVDAAIVVCEPEPAKLQMLQPYLKRLADLRIPHFLFVNKIDKASGSLRALLTMLQDASETPLLLRQIPIWENDAVSGFVDLALERAYIYRSHAASEMIAIADTDGEKEARFAMLEKLADYDEHLMEELLSDVEPPKQEVFEDLAKELAQGLVVPVLIGSAEGDNGIRRLLKALRHEVPAVTAAAKRLGIETNGDTVVQVLKTYHSSHGGKISLARILSGTLKDGALLRRQGGGEARVGGIFVLKGEAQTKLGEAQAGDTVALGRLEGVATGETLATGKTKLPKVAIEQLTPVYRLAIEAADRKDEVKLTAAIAKLREEDPSLIFDQNAELQEMALVGQGEIHLKVAVEKLQSKYGLKLVTHPSRVPYKETIRKGTQQHGRHKRQSGGHGQFGDVHIEVWPQPRGAGFEFHDRVVGGAVPRTFIGSVEEGVREYLVRGPLGFPVVDVAVALFDGQYHAVDSSDMAFKTAARMAMQEAMPKCQPVLLEPIYAVEVSAPNEFTARCHNLITGRRGQILNFGAKEGWTGWDRVEALLPQSELHDMIIELRSLTFGVGNFAYRFDHLQELTGRLADKVVEQRQAATAH
jgi:elongation factor G